MNKKEFVLVLIFLLTLILVVSAQQMYTGQQWQPPKEFKGEAKVWTPPTGTPAPAKTWSPPPAFRGEVRPWNPPKAFSKTEPRTWQPPKDFKQSAPAEGAGRPQTPTEPPTKKQEQPTDDSKYHKIPPKIAPVSPAPVPPIPAPKPVSPPTVSPTPTPITYPSPIYNKHNNFPNKK